jgi:hypothetical protein
MRLSIRCAHSGATIAGPVTERNALLLSLTPAHGEDWRDLEIGASAAATDRDGAPYLIERLADSSAGVGGAYYATNAPENYDGFGTHTVVLAKDRMPVGFRRVWIANEHYEWQRIRYGSGLYAVAPAPQLWALWLSSQTEEGAIPLAVLNHDEAAKLAPTTGREHPIDLKPGFATNVRRDSVADLDPYAMFPGDQKAGQAAVLGAGYREDASRTLYAGYGGGYLVCTLYPQQA